MDKEIKILIVSILVFFISVSLIIPNEVYTYCISDYDCGVTIFTPEAECCPGQYPVNSYLHSFWMIKSFLNKRPTACPLVVGLCSGEVPPKKSVCEQNRCVIKIQDYVKLDTHFSLTISTQNIKTSARFGYNGTDGILDYHTSDNIEGTVLVEREPLLKFVNKIQTEIGNLRSSNETKQAYTCGTGNEVSLTYFPRNGEIRYLACCLNSVESIQNTNESICYFAPDYPYNEVQKRVDDNSIISYLFYIGKILLGL